MGNHYEIKYLYSYKILQYVNTGTILHLHICLVNVVEKRFLLIEAYNVKLGLIF